MSKTGDIKMRRRSAPSIGSHKEGQKQPLRRWNKNLLLPAPKTFQNNGLFKKIATKIVPLKARRCAVGDTSTVHRSGRGATSRCGSARCVLRGFVSETE
eukprot:6188660-Pleurochrysis_carterae.AAC.1